MPKKKITSPTKVKKKQGQRWKAKPIVNVKKKTLNDKVKIVKDLQKELPKEKEWKEMWAPKKMTWTTIQTLKLCFSVGMTDEQACYFSKISTSSLYAYQKEHPDFLEEKEILKESIAMQARVNVWRSIKNWNVWDSWKWLEKKDKSFVPKLEVGWEVKINLTEEQKKKEETLLKKLKKFAVW